VLKKVKQMLVLPCS